MLKIKQTDVCQIVVLLLLVSFAFASAAAVRLESTGTRWDEYGNFLSEFRLTNESDETISYGGYLSSEPLYTMQRRRFGHWVDIPLGWCGVGLGTQRLAANQSVAFSVQPPEGSRTWRIAVQLTPVPTDGREHTIWSAAITSPSRTQIEASATDATGLVEAKVLSHLGGEYTFVLTNITTNSCFYAAYREPNIPPIYFGQERQRGRWKDDGIADWSGTDLAFRELRPRQSLRFSIPAQSFDWPWRIGLRLFRSNAPRSLSDAYRPVWWQELPPRKKPVIDSASAAPVNAAFRHPNNAPG